MFDAQEYIGQLIEALKKTFGNRLVYVGLQGSYLRGEAREDSDIDPMVVIDQLTPADLDTYRAVLNILPHPELSCGFLCGKEQLKQWNRLEMFHLLRSTKDCYGELSLLVPEYTQEDAKAFVMLSLNNLLHGLTHRRIHADAAQNAAGLPGDYKAAFFILQDLHCLRHGSFIQPASQLAEAMEGMDRKVLLRHLAFRKGASCECEADFCLLFQWVHTTMSGL